MTCAMPESPTYTRKLSRGEVSDGSILIEKTKWRFFPPPGEPMTLEAGGGRFSVAIEAEDCSCMAPPHQHYHLPAAPARSTEDGLTAYTSNWGLPELRVAIARQLKRLYGVSYDPATEIIITTGVSEGLNLATQAILDEGDEVLSTDPAYVAYMPNRVFAGGVVGPVPTTAANEFRLEAAELEKHITPRSKAILLGYPANPTGAVMDRASLEAIADAVRRNDPFVISDEIYDRLLYGVEHVCFSSLPGMKERTLLLGGFSKTYAMTGFRLGWVCAPAFLTEAMVKGVPAGV